MIGYLQSSCRYREIKLSDNTAELFIVIGASVIGTILLMFLYVSLYAFRNYIRWIIRRRKG